MPLRVLFLGAYYEPELTAIGPYTAQLARELGRRGHRVAISTTFPHFPEWRFHDGYRAGLYRRERHGNVVVRRARHILPRRPDGVPGRAAYDLSFAAGAALTGALAGPVDVVVAISPPLTSALAAIALARPRRAPLVLWLQDLTADVALELGVLRRDSLAFRLAAGLERHLYGQTRAIVVIEDAFKGHLLARGVPARKIVVQPNWIDVDAVRPLAGAGRFRARHGFAACERLVLHAGNQGVKQELENVLLAAERLRDERDVRIVLVGEGSGKPTLERRARERQLANVTFLPFQPAAELADMLSSADLLLVNQRGAIRDAVVPSKLLSYMAAGRPIIGAVHPDSATARTIRCAGAGVLVPPDDPAALADGIHRALADPAGLRALGERGRAYVVAERSASVALPRLSRVIEDVARRKA